MSMYSKDVGAVRCTSVPVLPGGVKLALCSYSSNVTLRLPSWYGCIEVVRPSVVANNRSHACLRATTAGTE